MQDPTIAASPGLATPRHPLPRNTARYCDGLSREFAVAFIGLGTGRVVYAAVAGTTCTDPLDCVALTRQEAEATARGLLAYHAGASGQVIPLPEGWRND